MMCGTPDPAALQTCLWRILEVVAAAGGAAGLAAATRLAWRARSATLASPGTSDRTVPGGLSAEVGGTAGRARRGKARRSG